MTWCGRALIDALPANRYCFRFEGGGRPLPCGRQSLVQPHFVVGTRSIDANASALLLLPQTRCTKVADPSHASTWCVETVSKKCLTVHTSDIHTKFYRVIFLNCYLFVVWSIIA